VVATSERQELLSVPETALLLTGAHSKPWTWQGRPSVVAAAVAAKVPMEGLPSHHIDPQGCHAAVKAQAPFSPMDWTAPCADQQQPWGNAADLH